MIGWGKYGGYEGPYSWGSYRYVPPADASFEQKCMAVLSATEGCLDAVNMYDRCICSVGAIQWCEAGMFGVSQMLGYVVDHTGQDLSTGLRQINPGIEFRKGRLGRMSFFLQGKQVEAGPAQVALFLRNATGKIGSWTEADKQYAKNWIVFFQNLFSSAAAREAQVAYTMSRLQGFVVFDVWKDLFATGLGGKWIEAARAGYVSFGANLPAVASRHYQSYVVRAGGPTDTADWVAGLLQELTFGPKISIYPDRYNRIRPVLEASFGVDLPDFAEDLRKFEARTGPVCDQNVSTPIGLQKALLALGYDMGPTGPDGLIWSWHRDPIMQFQQDHGLPLSGYVDEPTQFALQEAMAARGISVCP